MRFFKRPKEKLERELIGTVANVDEGDRRSREELGKLGADLAQPRSVRHYLYLPDRGAALVAARQLEADGYTVEIIQDNEKSWWIRASHLAVVTLESLVGLRALLGSVAAPLGGKYDGWEGAPTP